MESGIEIFILKLGVEIVMFKLGYSAITCDVITHNSSYFYLTLPFWVGNVSKLIKSQTDSSSRQNFVGLPQ